MTLDELCDKHAVDLVDTPVLRPRVLLRALAQVESSYGRDRMLPRHEMGYCYGGMYYRGPNGVDIREQSGIYGCLAHMSYGSWQIMFITAYELGFRGSPLDLMDDETSIVYVVRLLNRRILSKYPRIATAGFADTYNSGRPDDPRTPSVEDYIRDFEAAYNDWLKKIEPPTVLRA